MKPHIALALVLVAATATLGAVRSSGKNDVDTDSLGAREIQKYFAPYRADVRACYATHGAAGDGHLRLTLTIAASGDVRTLDFDAPGVTGSARDALDHCLRPLADHWHFPVRRGETEAVLPFFFTRNIGPTEP